ncbi:DUF4893 domain-containing protein [Mesorhizobium sp. AaZ16]|uniref:DUF4893 domain-containing protein n=1 Tax=Mesorhizobium sp. AaZ16 TaxID=3402289 RepID=UPI00374FBBFA
MKIRAWFLAALLALPAGNAGADGAVQKLITPVDKARLENHEATRKEALAQARDGATADVAALDTVLAAEPISWSAFDMVGDWQCRTTKAGGLAKLVVYGWFKCRVSDDGSGWMLEKVSGSQRTKGRFFDDGEKRLIYLGSFHVAGATAKPYANGPESDQVGYAFRAGPQGWRIEFPAPYYESKLDILEFRR